MPNVRHGSCNCQAVRLEMVDAPIRVGMCHCQTCRKETGSPFMAFAVWEQSQVHVTGATQSWIQTTDHRHFCPACGSTLFSTHDDDTEIEIRIGCLDEAPTDLEPVYELWTARREHWLLPVTGAVQHQGNRG